MQQISLLRFIFLIYATLSSVASNATSVFSFQIRYFSIKKSIWKIETKKPCITHNHNTKISLTNINKLAKTSYLYMRNKVDDAAFFNTFDESVASSIIGYGKPKSVFRFKDFDLLWSRFLVCKYEIVQTDLSTQQLCHVDFMRI